MINLDLEKAIDKIGRERLFDFVRAQGWGVDNAPPEWVWWQAIAELQNRINTEPVK